MLKVSFDASSFGAAGARFHAVAGNNPVVLSRAINHTGNKARTQMIRSLTAQTGLKRKTIVKALKKRSASPASPVYVISSKGGDISLKYFWARETSKGVTAAPWGKRKLYPSTFIKGGRFPERVDLPKLNGHVFKRRGKNRLPIAKQKSGVFIPTEMVTGATLEAFNRTVASELPKRIAHELYRILG